MTNATLNTTPRFSTPTDPAALAEARAAMPVRQLMVNPAELTTDRWLVDDDPYFSNFLAVLSAVFPRGEDFFVESVRRHRDAVKDNPVLRAQVRAFVGQEAMHGRQHRALNERLQTLGYPTEHADRAIGRACDRILKLRPNTLAVAATAAAEHLTGVFAAVVLSDDRTRHLLFSQPEVEPLIAWHALEELEHKNVAFDVMTTVGVRYPTRIAGFLVTISMLATVVTQQWIAALIGMHSELTWKQRRRFIHNLRRQRLLHPSFVIETLKYLRPGFHPDDTNTDHLVRQWRARLINEGAIRENRSPAA